MSRLIIGCLGSLLIAALLPATAAADIVHMKTGQKIEGKVLTETSTEVEVQTKFGRMKLEKANIERIERKRVPKEEVAARVKAAGDNATLLWEAAEYAKENKLTKDYRQIVEKVLKADPEHSAAHQALGHIYFDEQWFESPEALERYKVTVAEEMKRQGKVLYNGKWVKEETAKRLQGFELYKGQWLTHKEIYTLQAQEKMPELLGVSLEIRDSEHFTLRSQLDDDVQDTVLEMVERGLEHFIQVFKPDEIEHNIMTFYPIAIYVFPDSSYVVKFVEEGGYMDQLYNPPKDINSRYVDATSFPVFFPRPLIVTSAGRHLKGGGSREVSLLGFLSHYSGNMYIRRFKRGGKIPGWIESGITHYYESTLNGFRTLSITEYTGYEHVEKWKTGLDTFPLWYKEMSDPAFRAKLPRFASMKGKMVEELDGFELVKAYFMVVWLMETDQTRLVDYARLAFSDPHGMRVVIPEEKAFEDVFQERPDDFDARFEEWARRLPPTPPIGG